MYINVCSAGNVSVAYVGSWLFQPTSPQSEPLWSPPGPRRSTFDLVQACIFTLILCSWTAVHPDIPAENMERRWKYKRLFSALCAIIFPELFLWIAFDELWESRLICLKLKNLEATKEEPKVSPDGNAHRTSIRETVCGLWHIVCRTWRNVFPPELERGFYIEMGGFELVSDLGEGRDLPSGFKGRVTPWGAIELARVGLLPKVPLELINDQSKSDLLAKFLVCLQAGWMVIQCIARVAQCLPLTLLEVHTVMNAICAFFIYCLWLKKPHDVRVTTKVRVNDEMLKELKNIVANSPPRLDRGRDVPRKYGGRDVPRKFKLTETEPDAGFLAVARSSCGLSQSKQSPISELVMTCLAFPTYGGVHLTVWKGHFPSNLERILWRASALSIMGLPFLVLAGEFLLKWIRHQSRKGRCKDSESYLASLRRHQIWGWFVLYKFLATLQGIALGFWVFARIYIVVESFASLRNLPIGSYDAVSWLSLIPHF